MTITPDDLRKLAASESAYVASRLVTYREDGQSPPLILTKLGALAAAVLECTPSLAAKADDGIDWRITAAVAAECETRANDALATARTALYEIGVVLSAVNAALDGSEPTAAQEPVRLRSADEPRRPIGTVLKEAWNNMLANGEVAAPPVIAPLTLAPVGAPWPASGLRHGLVLVRGENDRRIFSEPIRGQYSVQTVAPSGETAGEPWSTTPDAWTKPHPDAPEGALEWREETRPIAAKPCLPRWDVAPPKPAKPAKVDKPKAEDRTIQMFDTPPAAPRKTVADYAPDDAQFAKWLGAINTALDAASKPHVDDAKMREVFASWQAANASEEKANPAAAFWHAAKAIIVGGAT